MIFHRYGFHNLAWEAYAVHGTADFFEETVIIPLAPSKPVTFSAEGHAGYEGDIDIGFGHPWLLELGQGLLNIEGAHRHILQASERSEPDLASIGLVGSRDDGQKNLIAFLVKSGDETVGAGFIGQRPVQEDFPAPRA